MREVSAYRRMQDQKAATLAHNSPVEFGWEPLWLLSCFSLVLLSVPTAAQSF